MAQQKKGIIARMLEGKERSEEYARNSLPTSRWQLFFDIFKNNFSKLVKVNLLMLLFLLPTVALIVVYFMIGEMNGTLFPFGANLSVGYPVFPNQNGLSEGLTLSMGYILYAGLFLTSFLAALGIAGGVYVIRNMVWTEGIFVSNDFWRGIKLNYKEALQASLLFVIVFSLSDLLINFTNFTLAVGEYSGGMKVWMTISQVISYGFIAFFAMVAFWMIALGVNYQFKFIILFKNAVIMTVGMLPQTIFFMVVALAPFLLFLFNGTFFTTVAVTILIFFGFSYALLVWIDFAQWAFDQYINPKTVGARVGRGLYNPNAPQAASQSESTVEYQRSLLSFGKSRLVANPIKPIDDELEVYELPSSFTREDLKRLRESKQQIAEDTEAYKEEHKDDERYVEYNKQFDDLEKALQEQDQKKKNKKKPKLLGQ